jgi:hypothetical protein
LNPDLIGQIFLELLRPGPEWRQYFPTWADALARAGELYPPDEMADLIHQELVHTALLRQQRGDPTLVPLEPDVNFEAWLEALEPHFEPILIGPNAINSSAMMLAIAAQFPDWTVARGLVLFAWSGVDPLLQQMANINICLYGLNGYTLKLYQTAREIAAVQAAPERRPPAPELPPLLPELLAPTAPGATPPDVDQPGKPTFEQLFRQG